MTTIVGVRGREILDSRGRPTVEAQLTLSDGTTTAASVPSGASTGRHEAVELRDGDRSRFRGRGVLRAVAAVNGEIDEALRGRRADLRDVDRLLIELDGTPDKSRLGANATLAVSLACARAEAALEGVPLWRHLGDEPLLPLPMVNIVSGGLHAGGLLDFQDFLVVPVGAERYRDALRMAVEVYEATADVLHERGLTTLKADEGGFGPPLPSHAAALELLDTAVERAGLRLGDDIAYALDIASTHFYDVETAKYVLGSEGRTCSSAELEDLIAGFADSHPIVSVEDPLAEDDWEGWVTLTAGLGGRLQIVGDDLFTTNLARLDRGVAAGAANAVLVKMNQIGTITQTLEVVERAKQAGYGTVVSARSGETEDFALADLAVATASGQIKIGSVAQSERLAKYNQLLRIEEALGDDARYAGRAVLQR